MSFKVSPTPAATAVPAESVPARSGAGPYHSPSASVMRGALMLIGTQPLTWISSFVLAALLPHYLGARELGVLAVALTVTGLVKALSAMGVPGYLTREVARRPSIAMELVSLAIGYVGAVSLLAAAATDLLLPRLGVFSEHVGLLRVLLVGSVAANCLGLMTSLLQGQERHARYAWCIAGGVVVSTWAGIAVLIAGGGVTPFAAANVLGTIGVTIVAWRWAGLKFTRRALSPAGIRRLAHGGFPFLGWDVTIIVRAQIDIVIVAALAGSSAAGWLAAAYRIIAIPAFIPTLINTPLFPALSRTVHDSSEFRRTLRRTVFAAALLAVPASAGIFALAPAVPGLLHWPAEFEHSRVLIMTLTIAYPLVAVDTLLGTALFALGRERHWLKVAIGAAIFNIGSNLIAVPLSGHLTGNPAAGAAVVEVITEIIMLAGAVMLLPQGVFDRTCIKQAGKLVLCAIVLAAAASLALHWSVPLAIAAGAVVYAASIWVLRLVPAAALRELRDASVRQLAHALRASERSQPFLTPLPDTLPATNSDGGG